MDLKPTPAIAVLLLLVAASAAMFHVSDASRSGVATDIRQSVGAAISMISGEWGLEEPLFPPMDATSLIRLHHEGRISYNGPTRADPIPTNWDLVSTNTHSRIFVEDGLTLPSEDIQALADIFDHNIFPNATDWFHPSNPYDSIDIRIYDFGDGPGNTGGFFLGSYATRNDLFVDSADLVYSRSWSFEIVAHEFQHLLHYDLDGDEEVWLNEGLADLSARISLGPGTSGIQSHIETYEIYPENDLLAWNEGQPPDYIETIADYGRAYAFVSYLADHYGGKEFIQDIVEDPRNSVSSINGELAEDGIQDRFNDIVIKEKIANLLDDRNYGGGIYDQGLIDIGIRSFEFQSSSYPAVHEIEDTVRYSGYYMRLLSGSPDLSVSLDSSSKFFATLIGVSDGDIVSSVNLSGDGSDPVLYSLTGFGSDYQQLHVVVHSEKTGADIQMDVEISDLEPPVTEVLVSPPDPTGENGFYLEPPGISLSTSEGSEVQFSWDGYDFEQYTSSLHPPEGASTLQFYARGPFGLREDERSLSFKVDTIDPVSDHTIYPSEPDGDDGYYLTDPTITLSTLYPEDEIFYDLGDGEAIYDGPFQPGHGEWSVDYVSRDLAGREGPGGTIHLKVDLGDPSLDLRVSPSGPDGSGGYYATSPELSMGVDDGATGWFYLNGEGPYEYSSPFTLEDGEWEVEYFASTPSGREGDRETVYLKVDTTPPSLIAEFDPPICSSWCSKPTYLSLETGDPLADIEFTLGGEGPFSYSSPVLLGDGEYTISFRAVDPAGNIAEGGTVDIKVDNTVPLTEIVTDRFPDRGDWYYDTPPGIDFRNSGTPVSPETTFISMDGEEFVPYTGQTIELQSGSNTVHFYSQDLAGNREPVRRKDINIDTSRPSGSLFVNRTLIPERGPVLFDISGSSDDIEIYRFSMDFGDGTRSGWIYDTEITHTYDGLGEYEAVLTVEDAAGRSNEERISVTIEVLTREDYESRMEGDRFSVAIVLITVVLILIALASVVVLLIVMVRRRRSTMVMEDVAWEDG